MKRILSPFFSRFYDQAGKSSRKILGEIARKGGEMSLSELSELMRKGYNELSPYLAKLFHKLLAQYILVEK